MGRALRARSSTMSTAFVLDLEPAPRDDARRGRPRVVAVILAYNVAGMLGKALRKIPGGLVDDVFVMDDGSRDGTFEEARRLGLDVYRNETNLGYGGNLRRGLARAVRDYGAEYVVEVHGDGAQFNPSAIATAIPMMNDGVPFIMGSRFVESGSARRNGMPWVRLLANRGLSALSRRVLGLPLTEFHSGFRVYSRSFIEALPLEANSPNHLFSFEVLAQAAYFGQRVAEVPVEADYLSAHTSISLRAACVYALATIACMGKYVLAKLGLRHSPLFPRR
jgi:glycosyltransferase involved in cell wall biosynthesis